MKAAGTGRFDELAGSDLSPLRILQMTTIDERSYWDAPPQWGRQPRDETDLVLLDGGPSKDAAQLYRIGG